MDLPTYTNIWRIEKRLYKLYDLRLPMPLPLVQIGVFLGVFVPWIVLMRLVGLPFESPWHVLYVVPPGVLTWLATRPVIEGKRLTELLLSQGRFLAEPRTWCRLTPIREPREVVVVARVWRRAPAPERARKESRRRVREKRGATAPAAVPIQALQAEPVHPEPVPMPRPAVADAPPPLAGYAEQREPARAEAPVPGSPGTGHDIRVPAAANGLAAPPTAKPWRRTARDIVHEDDVQAGVPQPSPAELERPPATPRLEAPPAQGSGKRALASGVRRPGAQAEFWKAISPENQPPPPTTRPDIPVQEPPKQTAQAATEPPFNGEPGDKKVAGTRRPPERPVAPPPTTRPDIPVQAAPTRPDIPMVPGAFGAHPDAPPLPTRPEADPTPQPETDPAPKPAAEPAPDPAQESAPKPAAEPAPQPAAESAPTPAPRPAVEHAPQLASRPAAEPAAQSAAEGAAQPAAEHASRAAAEPAGMREDEQRGESAPELQPEPQSQPVAEPRARAAGESAAEGEGAAAPTRIDPPKPWTKGLSKPLRAATTDNLLWPPTPDRVPDPPQEAPGAAPEVEEAPPREVRSQPASPVRPRPLPPPPAAPPSGPAITPPDPEHEVTSGGLRRLIQAVGGGHGEVDAEYQQRLQQPFHGTRHIVVLGCTGGAGQTVTALMLGHTFAQHNGEPVVAVDVNPGPGALARRTRSETNETLTGLITRADQVGSLTAMRRYTSQAKSGLDVIAAGKNPLQALDDRDYALAIRTIDRFYSVTLLDAAAAVVARVLPYADQIVLVAPASADAPRAVAMTYEWLDGHGYEELRSRAVTVINGVSRRSMEDVEEAEAVARGRCRALVRIPWDDHLSMDRAPRNELKSLRAPTRRAYLALAGVVAGGFTVVPERYQELQQEQEATR
ncbi:TcpE family conjugal transfer membrane protein [Spirillospora albida]|uniref:TcpE family conjugal transfer membrane protein n=1 Tax=Spirillospora albida TaxID=58123 RepID=UPI0004C037B2|nr:TcpE family conjugal transfer membrane protein [Spirillospora albida]